MVSVRTLTWWGLTTQNFKVMAFLLHRPKLNSWGRFIIRRKILVQGVLLCFQVCQVADIKTEAVISTSGRG